MLGVGVKIQRRWSRMFRHRCFVVGIQRAVPGRASLVQPVVSVREKTRGVERGFTEDSLSLPSESSTCAGVFSSNFSSNSARSSLILAILRFARSIFRARTSFSDSTSTILRLRSLHFWR
jgi:hypothetical protein